MPRTRKGAVIVLYCSGMVVFTLFVSLVIDVGYWLSCRAAMQTIADLAAVSSLGNIDTESTYATQVAKVNSVVDAVSAQNGYSTTYFAVICTGTPAVSPTLVTTVTLTASETVPAFFSRVVGLQSVAVKVRARSEAYVEKVPVPPCSFFAKQDVTWGGAGNEDGVIDSYDSRNGPYTPGDSFDDKAFVRANANGCANDDIYYNGNVAQFGNLYSFSDTEVIGGAALVDGSILARGTVDTSQATIIGQVKAGVKLPYITIPDVVAPADITSVNDNACCVTIENTVNDSLAAFSGTVLNESSANRVVHLQAGKTYYFTRVDLTGNVPVVVDGDPLVLGSTRIYLDGEARFLGGVSFSSSVGGISAQHLQIYGMASGADLEIGGGSTLYADVYAPNMNFELHGNSHMLGRVFANNIDFDGQSSFSFDEALGLRSMDTTTVRVRVHLIE